MDACLPARPFTCPRPWPCLIIGAARARILGYFHRLHNKRVHKGISWACYRQCSPGSSPLSAFSFLETISASRTPVDLFRI